MPTGVAMILTGPVHACGASGLGLWEQVGCYCERGTDPTFWAEPLNALSNLAFIVAALMAYTDLRVSALERGRGVLLALILWLMVIGVGSFLFHSFATRWAALADVVPIGVFVFAYVLLAYRWLLGLPVWGAAGIAILVTAATFALPSGLNGSTLYLPSLAMMALTAGLLWWRGRRIWVWIGGAAGVFLVSLTLRTLDRSALFCGPHAIGAHWAWHVLNAVTLYLLLRGAIEERRAAR